RDVGVAGGAGALLEPRGLAGVDVADGGDEGALRGLDGPEVLLGDVRARAYDGEAQRWLRWHAGAIVSGGGPQGRGRAGRPSHPHAVRPRVGADLSPLTGSAGRQRVVARPASRVRVCYQTESTEGAGRGPTSSPRAHAGDRGRPRRRRSRAGRLPLE